MHSIALRAVANICCTCHCAALQKICSKRIPLHERIDLLSASFSLLAKIASLEKRIALLEGTPDCTDLPGDFLHKLD